MNNKKISALLLIFILAFSLAGCGKNKETPKVAVPSLKELVGRYEDGTYTFAKVHISEKMLAEAQKKADDAAAEADEDDPFDQIGVAEAGCDIEMLRGLKALEGQTKPNPFTISASSETGGTLQFDNDKEDDAEPPEPALFNYNPGDGALTFAFAELPEGMKLANSLYAAYIEQDKVKVSGTLKLTTTEAGESDFYIDITITGTKPLSGQ